MLIHLIGLHHVLKQCSLHVWPLCALGFSLCVSAFDPSQSFDNCVLGFMGNRSARNRNPELTGKLADASGFLPCPPPCLDRSLSYEVDHCSPLHRLPEEMFFSILQFVPPMDLICNGRLVCKYWLDIIDGDTLWRSMCQKHRIPFPDLKIEDEAGTFTLDYRCIYLKRPFHRNLVKNWNAADGFNDWEVIENGGNRFAVEPNECGYSDPVSSIGVPGCLNCWVTSYQTCKKSQRVDLLAEGCTRAILDTIKPTIVISEWTAARFDCASYYFLHVTLESDTGRIVDVFDSERFVDQWKDKSWIKVSHKFCNYPAGVRYVKVVHGGKDSQFWAGHFGPKITATSVMISLENCHLCHGPDQLNQ